MNVEDLLNNYDIPKSYISNIINSDLIDKYVLFKNVCLAYIGEKTTDDFKTLVVDPIMELYIKPAEKNKQYRIEQLSKAKSNIKVLMPTIIKTISTLETIEPYIIAGTPVEDMLIKLNQIEFLVSNQFED